MFFLFKSMKMVVRKVELNSAKLKVALRCNSIYPQSLVLQIVINMQWQLPKNAYLWYHYGIIRGRFVQNCSNISFLASFPRTSTRLISFVPNYESISRRLLDQNSSPLFFGGVLLRINTVKDICRPSSLTVGGRPQVAPPCIISGTSGQAIDC